MLLGGHHPEARKGSVVEGPSVSPRHTAGGQPAYARHPAEYGSGLPRAPIHRPGRSVAAVIGPLLVSCGPADVRRRPVPDRRRLDVRRSPGAARAIPAGLAGSSPALAAGRLGPWTGSDGPHG